MNTNLSEHNEHDDAESWHSRDLGWPEGFEPGFFGVEMSSDSQ